MDDYNYGDNFLNYLGSPNNSEQLMNFIDPAVLGSDVPELPQQMMLEENVPELPQQMMLEENVPELPQQMMLEENAPELPQQMMLDENAPELPQQAAQSPSWTIGWTHLSPGIQRTIVKKLLESEPFAVVAGKLGLNQCEKDLFISDLMLENGTHYTIDDLVTRDGVMCCRLTARAAAKTNSNLEQAMGLLFINSRDLNDNFVNVGLTVNDKDSKFDIEFDAVRRAWDRVVLYCAQQRGWLHREPSLIFIAQKGYFTFMDIIRRGCRAYELEVLGIDEATSPIVELPTPQEWDYIIMAAWRSFGQSEA